ncbi:hypothetical protein B0H17DRAFT_1328206 [Mycena rosella]|uniref:Uncharacterized protein n=1 Tax=Mycena rosella TaxID=1033263 RepID=A0AAD7GNN7_MYCRO|nr:hypothetical protein B0H17DRAFT_1328206 [Mycena rosella]
MKSSESESAYSQGSGISSQAATIRARPSNAQPSSSHSSPAQLYGMTATVPPRRSPQPLIHRSRDSTVDMVSPFTVASATESYSRDLLPMSPMSRLLEEIDPLGETTPTTGAPPETPSFDAYGMSRPSPTDMHVPPLPQRDPNEEDD